MLRNKLEESFLLKIVRSFLKKKKVFWISCWECGFCGQGMDASGCSCLWLWDTPYISNQHTHVKPWGEKKGIFIFFSDIKLTLLSDCIFPFGGI